MTLNSILLEFYNRFAGRAALLAFAAEKRIPVQQTAAKPWSTGMLYLFTMCIFPILSFNSHKMKTYSISHTKPVY